MNNKYNELLKYSDPNIVYSKAKKLFGDNIKIKPSSRKNKKYQIELDNKWIHFGQMGYMDYTKHNDEKRRNNFINRNHKWVYRNYDSPAFLSYVLLW